MIVERPRRAVGAIAVPMALLLVVLMVRARPFHFRTAVPEAIARAPAAAAPASAAPAAVASAAAAPAAGTATPSTPPAIPTRTVPCIDDTTELLVDGDGNPVLCWGGHCLRVRARVAAPVTRPVAPSAPDPIVGAEQVCT